METTTARRRGAVGRASVAVLVLASITLIGVPTPGQAQGDYEPDTFNVEKRSEEQVRPRISGKYVVWQDYRNAAGVPTGETSINADIYGRDIDRDRSITVTTNKTAAHPAISGGRVVFTDSRNQAANGLDIRGFNIDSGDVFEVVDRSGDQDWASIDGDVVVWQDNRSGNWDIRGRNLKKEDNFDVATRNQDEKKPSVSGKLVAYEDYRRSASEPDIFYVDIDSDDDPVRVSDNGESRDPSISGDWIAYRTGDPNGDQQRIRLYNIKNKSISTLTERVKIAGGPRVAGSLVVWADRRNEENYNIWAFDLNAGVSFRVSESNNDETMPDVSGNTIVWAIDRDDSQNDIRAARITVPATPTPTATATPAAAPGSGGAPSSQGPCTFTLGFKALRDQIPTVVGNCLENEWHNAQNGDGLQQSTGGLLVWRKADNWTAFTNGSITWLNGPCGLQTRPNQGPFYAWEGRVGAACS